MDSFCSHFEKNSVQPFFRLHIFFAFSFFNFEKRRLRNVNMSVFNQLFPLAVKKRQKKGQDMRSVNVSIGNNNYFVIPEFSDIKPFAFRSAADSCSKR